MKKKIFSTDAPATRSKPIANQPKPNQAKRDNRDSRAKRRPPLPWPWALAVFALLLILPVWAMILLSQKLDWRILGTIWAIISGLTIYFYWSDKRKAQQDQWRIPEGTLHLLELLGGWPAALVAQRLFRHKTKKVAYQTVFWLIGFFHQLLAFEVVSGRSLSRAIGRALQ